jgi:preprotein translocase subunit SecA
MEFSVPTGRLTERARTQQNPAWDDALRWLKSAAHWLTNPLSSSSERTTLPTAVRQAFEAAAPRMAQLTDAQRLSVAGELRAAFQHARAFDTESTTTTGQALALAGAVMARTSGLTPYATQYRAAWLILQGSLVEMATGEGKTVAAALAAAVAALGPQRVHLFTANDYLVQRDSEGLRPFCAALGLSVGHVLATSTPDERAAAYRCHITVVTAKELAFDYLKDHLIKRGETAPGVLRALALHAGEQSFSSPPLLSAPLLPAPLLPAPLLPALAMAILDEADSILLDEASMPLILAQPGAACDAAGHQRAFDITTRLQRGRDYAAFPAARAMRLTDAGRSLVSTAVQGAGGVLSPPQRAHELVEAALTARWMYRRDRDYAVSAVTTAHEKASVQLIDQITGRIADGRQWTGALQQMVELKEGVPLSAPAVTLAQITFQRFFPRYLRMGGMSGSLTQARHELRMRYDLAVQHVPLLRPSQRRWQGEVLFANAKARWAAVVLQTQQLARAGRPVLVGTDSVKDSAHLSGLLTAAGVPHQVLNALQNADEAACIARAGQAGVVTVATNMAGRGTDIQLDAAAKAAGGLHVLACMRNRNRRTDRQLRGRGARHGDPGSAQAMVALDDVLMTSFTPAWLRRALAAVAREGRVPAGLSAPVLSVTQRLAEAQESAHRRRLCLQDRQLGDLCGFAGLTE